MSEYATLRITRSAQDAAEDPAAPWVRLEQIVPAASARYASVADLYRAWMYAASGLSARKQRGSDCPVEFEGSIVRIFLGFYTWPSAPSLAYELSSTIGQVGEQQQVELPREFSAFVNNSKTLDLDCYMVDVTVAWESPVYNRYGERIAPPGIVNCNTHLEFAEECFGALRIAGRSVGGYHVLTIEVDKAVWEEPDAPKPEQTEGDKTFINPLPVNTTQSISISGIEPTVTALWLTGEGDATDTDQLRLEVPQCVQDVLAYCPGNPLYLLDWCDTISKSQVYYNSCTGEVVKVCHGLDPQQYCTRTALKSDPGPWLKRLVS